MTVFRDGWVCPSCYTPNRASDGRCYSCKKNPWAKPADGAGEPAAAASGETWERPAARGADQDRVIPAVLTGLLMPVGVLFIIGGFLQMLAGAFYVLLGIVLMLANADSVAGLLLFAACVLQFVFGWLYFKLGKKILVGRRWAWVVAAVLGSLPFVTLFGILLVKPDAMNFVPLSYNAIRLILIPGAYMTLAPAFAAIADIVIRGHYRRREWRVARQAAAAEGVTAG